MKIIDALSYLSQETFRDTADNHGNDVIAIGDDPNALDALIRMDVSDPDIRSMIVRVLGGMAQLKSVIEQAKILADSVDRWEEQVAAIIGRVPETGMTTKSIRDALAKLDV